MPSHAEAALYQTTDLGSVLPPKTMLRSMTSVNVKLRLQSTMVGHKS